MVWLFTGCFYYIALPASCFLVLVASLISNAYSFKGTLYFWTGSVSLAGLPMPEAVVISRAEAVVAGVILLLGGGILWMYTRLCSAKTAPPLHRRASGGAIELRDDSDASQIEEDEVKNVNAL